MSTQKPVYDYTVKLEHDLRDPIRRYAFYNNVQVRKVVNDAIRQFLKLEEEVSKNGGIHE
jgi:hypothetical protein